MKQTERVLSAIKQKQGIHFRELLRTTHYTIGQLQHHVHKLLKENKIVPFGLFRYTCFCTPEIKQQDRIIIGLIRQPSSRKILAHLLAHEGQHCSSLRSHMALSPSTISWHLKRLEQLDIVETKRHGHSKCIHFKHPEHIKHLLANFDVRTTIFK